ncbi:unnamed protein product, partial [Rotaria sp. Silwood1]
TTSPKINNTLSKIRHIPIQISKGDENLMFSPPSFSAYYFGGGMRPMGGSGAFSAYRAPPFPARP